MTDTPLHQEPTIGRIVHVFNRSGNDDVSKQNRPEAAIVTFVHSPSCINATVFNHPGTPCSQTSIQHVSLAGDANCGWDWPARV